MQYWARVYGRTNWVLNFEIRLKNNEFRVFFSKNGKFDDHQVKKSKKRISSKLFFQKSCSKFYADSNAKKKLLNFNQYTGDPVCNLCFFFFIFFGQENGI